LVDGTKLPLRWLLIVHLYREQKKEEFERYQRGNQNPYIEEEQTAKWSKEQLE